ncbi:MAG: glycosyltransferase [Spongiibacteraceae bacterium]
MQSKNTLLLVLPALQAKAINGARFYEKQAANGISRWAENFDAVTVACPALAYEDRGTAIEYTALADIEHIERIQFIELPHSWGLFKFLTLYKSTQQILSDLISRHQFLSFSIGGLIGDWGSVACMQAHRMRRKYSVWTDRVEHKVVKGSYRDRRGIGRLTRWARAHIEAPLMAALEKAVIKRSALGLFHGADCFEAYSPYSKRPFLVHDIHLKKCDQASDQSIDKKCDVVLSGGLIEIVYAGRIAAMKGPLEWIEALHTVYKAGIKFRATWLGDGPLMSEAKAKVAELKLNDSIHFAGMLTNRDELLARLRAAHVFVFCHKTPESPRSLIEALMAATPIVGYQSHYAADLLGNGDLSRQLLVGHNAQQLGEKLCEIISDRPALIDLIRASAQIGKQFSDDAVFKHRSELIKEYSAA